MGFLKAIVSWFYGIGVSVRNCLYNMNVLKGEKFDIPIICVGNIAVGGSGKTPTVEFLVKKLSGSYNIAVLSRGYKRRTKGYIDVQLTDSYLRVGDEPKQIKQHFPDTPVIVCESRVAGVRGILEAYPSVNMVIMDDGFQHRKIVPRVNIILSDYSTPINENRLLPSGTLRDKPSQLYRANIFLVSKTPDNVKPIERNVMLKSFKMYAYQSAFFTYMRSGAPKPLFADMALEDSVADGVKVVALSGIANPKSFHQALAQRYNVVKEVVYPDHYNYKVKDVRNLADELKEMGDDVVVITTEKDGVKLTNSKLLPQHLCERLYVLPIELAFRNGDEDKFIQKILEDVKQN